MPRKIITYSDGGARGNPGPAGIGAVVFNDTETGILAQAKEYIGETTNNQAEYKGVVLALELAKQQKADEIECRLDSELVTNQLKGTFKLKNQDFQESFIKIHNLKMNFKKVTFTHVRREKNKIADKLVNQAIDEGISK